MSKLTTKSIVDFLNNDMRLSENTIEKADEYNIIEKEIIQALEIKGEIDDIKNMMQTSEYRYSGEFAKKIDDRLRKLLTHKQQNSEAVT